MRLKKVSNYAFLFIMIQSFYAECRYISYHYSYRVIVCFVVMVDNDNELADFLLGIPRTPQKGHRNWHERRRPLFPRKSRDQCHHHQ